MGGVVNAVRSVAQVAIAPITAPIAAVKSVVAGDNVLQAAKNASLQTVAAMNPLAVAEAAAGASPTGFGAVAMGATDSATQNKFLISSAVGAAAAGGLAAAGGVGALGLSGGGAAAAAGGVEGAGALSAGGIAAAATPVAVGAAKNYLSSKPDNAVSSAAGSASRSPASEQGGIPTNALLIAAGVLVLVLIVNRRG